MYQITITPTSDPETFILKADGLDIADVFLDNEENTVTAMVDVTGDDLKEVILKAMQKKFPGTTPNVEYFGIDYT